MEIQDMPLVDNLIRLVKPGVLEQNELAYLKQAINLLFNQMAIGDSCITLETVASKVDIAKEQLNTILQSSGLVTVTKAGELLESKPFTLWHGGVASYFYLTRYFYYEKQICQMVNRLTHKFQFEPVEHNKVEALKVVMQQKMREHDFPNVDQYNSIISSILRKFSIITGGPGTGKTTSVVLILWAFYSLYGEDLKVKVCAPTGKAAKRVKESLAANIMRISQQLELDTSLISDLLNNKTGFQTIHRLLGSIHQSIHFKHNQANPLECDVLIIDETSMVSVGLFYKLLDAININTIKHVIFLGDPNQLSSVEEGFVLNSLTNCRTSDYLSHLTISKRNQGAIGELANAILAQDCEKIDKLVIESSEIILKPPKLDYLLASLFNEESYIASFINYCQSIVVGLKDSAVVTVNYSELFTRFCAHTILTVTNIGVLGVVNLNNQIEKLIRIKYGFEEPWYNGRSIIILANDRNLELYNGDIGICLLIDDKPRIYFEDGRSFTPELLPEYQLAFALTIHKSQGSEYDAVTVVIANTDAATSRLSQELIYTAITRAKSRLGLYLEPCILVNLAKTNRVSGLPDLINESL